MSEFQVLKPGDEFEVLDSYSYRYDLTMGKGGDRIVRVIELQEGDIVMYIGKQGRLYRFVHIVHDEDLEPTGVEIPFSVLNVKSFLEGIGYETS